MHEERRKSSKYGSQGYQGIQTNGYIANKYSLCDAALETLCAHDNISFCSLIRYPVRDCLTPATPHGHRFYSSVTGDISPARRRKWRLVMKPKVWRGNVMNTCIT
jgi:hypothetical protein